MDTLRLVLITDAELTFFCLFSTELKETPRSAPPPQYSYWYRPLTSLQPRPLSWLQSQGCLAVCPEGSLQCFGRSSSRLVAAVTFMRLPAVGSTVALPQDTFAASYTSAMSSEQDFGGGAMAVTLTLRLLMHGKVRDVKASPNVPRPTHKC